MIVEPKTQQPNNRNTANKDTKPKPKMAQRQSKGDVLIIKTDETKYSYVLKADALLKDLGAAMRSIRRSRIGDMDRQLRKYTERRCPACKELTEQAFGKDAQVSALTTEMIRSSFWTRSP